MEVSKLDITSSGLLIIAGLFLIMIAISFFNEKVTKLPTEIGLMTITLCLSLIILLLESMNITSIIGFAEQLSKLDIHDLILNGFLCFLLFSGSATIRMKDLTSDKLLIGSLSFLSTLVGTVIYAGLTYFLAKFVGVQMNFIECCILGSIISPTDPISAMSILKKAGLPRRLALIMEGESLFNDGMAVALFVTFTSLLKSSEGNPVLVFVKVVGWNVIGAFVVGISVSFVLFILFKRTSQKHLEIMISIAAVTTAYGISEQIEVSGPTAAVIAGIFFATQMCSLHGDNEEYYTNFYSFWTVIDKILNAVLYMLIGLTVLFLREIDGFIIVSITAIIFALISRYLSITIPVRLFSRNVSVNPKEYQKNVRKKDSKAMVKLLTWAGLKGGSCIALALGTKNIFNPQQYYFVLTSTYAVVVFSTIVQGLSVQKVYNWVKKDLY